MPDGGGLFLDLHADRENAAHHADQLVDAMVVDAVLRRGKEAVLPAEAEDVPGIDQGPALDRRGAAAKSFLQQLRRIFQLRGGVVGASRLPSLSRQAGRPRP